MWTWSACLSGPVQEINQFISNSSDVDMHFIQSVPYLLERGKIRGGRDILQGLTAEPIGAFLPAESLKVHVQYLCIRFKPPSNGETNPDGWFGRLVRSLRPRWSTGTTARHCDRQWSKVWVGSRQSEEP